MGTSVFLNPNVIPISNPFNQDLNTTDSPTFNNLTLTGDATVGDDLTVTGTIIASEISAPDSLHLLANSINVIKDRPADDVTLQIENTSVVAGSIARFRLTSGTHDLTVEINDEGEATYADASSYAFDQTVQAQGYKSSDGSAGVSQGVTLATTLSLTVKNGLITAVTAV